MTLGQLLFDLPIAAPPGALWQELWIADVQHDSRRVGPGDLFVTWSGDRHDGRRFVGEAAERGAVAVIGHAPAVPTPVPYLVTEHPRQLLAPIASRLHRHPDRELLTVGVTGTNGKTTVVSLVVAVLEASGRKTATLGTLGCRLGGLEIEVQRTTPEASDLHRTLRELRSAGAVAASLEVSSHALAQGRVAGVGLDAAVFTNLSRDHLDFHRDLDEYFAAKRGIFDLLRPAGVAVVGIDDPRGPALAEQLRTARPGGQAHRVITFGAGGDVAGRSVVLGIDGLQATFDTPRGSLPVASRLVGRYNLANLTAAVAVGEALGVAHHQIARGLGAAGPIPGRMERVGAGEPPVWIDYAHTPEALEAALQSVREVWPGRLLVVFGCGGERDTGKRPLMGSVAARLADLVVVTDDNPRGEEPSAIHRAIVDGITAAGASHYRVIPDRAEAIRGALELAARERGWAVVIAGKGHERVQSVGGRELPFSDREQARARLGELLGTATNG